MLRDPRARLLQKENGGVASARNAGIHASKGEFVAFIDADDLWHPTKIAKQMAILLSAGPSMALVYAPFRLIDAEGKVLTSQRRVSVNGWVLYRHFHANLVGNGSSILVRKSVVEELGGFDPALRAAGAEGCEDLLLQLRIAARYQFGEVPEYLIGYRRRPGSMSSNAEQMLRSGMLALRTALAECGHIPHLSHDAILIRYEWQRLRSAARRGRFGDGIRQFFRQFSRNPFLVMVLLGDDLIVVASRVLHGSMKAIKGRLGSSFAKSTVPRHFYEFDPASEIGRKRPVLMSLVLGRLARLDQTYRPSESAPRR
jgi:cellulose synthase/poly-beta-1,6-N-acetylglucosamine synthase-like glycosyltransferase